jgi:cell division protein FtsB
MAKKGVVKTAVFIAILLAVFLPPFAKYQEMRYRNKKLERQIKELKEETKRLGEEKRRLQSDITYIERKAREKIGTAKKGEIILKAPPAKR